MPSLLDRALNVGEAKKFKEYQRRVVLINAFEAELEHDTDVELRERMDALRERAADGESLDTLLPECFAVVRETGKRKMGMRHFDVQLIGGMALHDGQIAEMKTGEGKTLTATLAVVLNTLAGKGVHVVTVNDYLARRDAEWMTPIYTALGITVGVLLSQAIVSHLRTAPAKAGVTLLLVRWSSRTPRTFSSAMRLRDTAAWEMPRSMAASVNVPESTIATRQRSCLSSRSMS